MILPFILSVTVAYVAGWITGSTIADIRESAWHAYCGEASNDLQH